MFEEFVKKLSEELKKDLPGFSAQKMMAPLGRRPPIDYLQKGVVPQKSAVLILLYPQLIPFLIKTVFILRSENEGGNHSGQISFPGGKIDDSDEDLSETALREAEEEIGVDSRSVALVGELTPLYIPVSNYMVHPFIGVMNSVPKFNIHAPEVQALIEVDINDLVAHENKKSVEKYLKIKDSKMEVPCYDIKGQIIWGATAMIISEFSELIRKIK